MGARLLLDFLDHNGSVVARVYDHWAADNPTSATAVVQSFLRQVKAQCKDTRFSDPSYLAAKFVVWRALHYNMPEHESGNPLDFLSLGIMPTDHTGLGAEEQRARIKCGRYPVIEILSRNGSWETPTEEVPYDHEENDIDVHQVVGNALRARAQRIKEEREKAYEAKKGATAAT